MGGAVIDASGFRFRRLVEAQRRFFQSGRTLPCEARREWLAQLLSLLERNEARIARALADDLGKPAFEAYTSETGFCQAEVRYASKHLKRWMRPERVGSPWTLFPARSRIEREPLGSVLVLAPWNFPLQLVVAPWIAALAAGNCAVLKPSELAPHTAALLAELIGESFPEELVAVVTGGPETSRSLLEERFDHVVFTGSAAVAREVAAAAARHLTPLTLELGGKNPCLVDERCDLALAARRIAWGKFMNAGQTCVAPDYVLVPETHRAGLVCAIEDNVARFFGPDPSRSPDYGRIVSERHFDRLVSYLDCGRIAWGGRKDRERLHLAPTLLEGAPPDSPPLSEEIFGPILPLVTYRSLDEAIAFARRHPHPLALYLFSSRDSVRRRVLREIPSGGAAVNDVILQFMNPRLPFGGRGTSGIGHYHGRFGFELLSHRKGVVEGSSLDIPLRYPPYEGKLRWIRKILR
jgi:acyl-CoA reductase-like NAD-dependent aldehyde dehydrogenase